MEEAEEETEASCDEPCLGSPLGTTVVLDELDPLDVLDASESPDARGLRELFVNSSSRCRREGSSIDGFCTLSAGEGGVAGDSSSFARQNDPVDSGLWLTRDVEGLELAMSVLRLRTPTMSVRDERRLDGCRTTVGISLTGEVMSCGVGLTVPAMLDEELVRCSMPGRLDILDEEPVRRMPPGDVRLVCAGMLLELDVLTRLDDEDCLDRLVCAGIFVELDVLTKPEVVGFACTGDSGVGAVAGAEGAMICARSPPSIFCSSSALHDPDSNRRPLELLREAEGAMMMEPRPFGGAMYPPTIPTDELDRGDRLPRGLVLAVVVLLRSLSEMVDEEFVRNSERPLLGRSSSSVMRCDRPLTSTTGCSLAGETTAAD